MRSSVARLALIAALLAGCGGSTPKHKTYHGIFVENLPKHRVYNLNWVERAPPRLMTFRVERLEVGPTGWKATVSFTNTSRQAIKLPTGGPRSPKAFGLGVFVDPLSPRIEDPGNYLIKADIQPPLPKRLRPGQAWAGTFSSPEPPRAGRTLRVLFGTFVWVGKPPDSLAPFFAWPTYHYATAPGPQGAAAAARTTTTGG